MVEMILANWGVIFHIEENFQEGWEFLKLEGSVDSK